MDAPRASPPSSARTAGASSPRPPEAPASRTSTASGCSCCGLPRDPSAPRRLLRRDGRLQRGRAERGDQRQLRRLHPVALPAVLDGRVAGRSRAPLPRLPQAFPIQLDPRGSLLATEGRAWRTATGGRVRSLDGIVELSPDGRLALVRRDSTATVVRVGSGAAVVTLRGFGGFRLPDVSAIFSPDGRRVVTLRGEALNLWDTATGESLGRLGRAGDTVEGYSFGEDGRLVLVTVREPGRDVRRRERLARPVAGRALRRDLAGRGRRRRRERRRRHRHRRPRDNAPLHPPDGLRRAAHERHVRIDSRAARRRRRRGRRPRSALHDLRFRGGAAGAGPRAARPACRRSSRSGRRWPASSDAGSAKRSPREQGEQCVGARDRGEQERGAPRRFPAQASERGRDRVARMDRER